MGFSLEKKLPVGCVAHPILPGRPMFEERAGGSLGRGAHKDLPRTGLLNANIGAAPPGHEPLKLFWTRTLCQKCRLQLNRGAGPSSRRSPISARCFQNRTRSRRRRFFSLLVGTLQLARNAPDAKLSDQILKSGECAAIKLTRSSEHHI